MICLYVYRHTDTCVYAPVISITLKQITAETSNLIFCISTICKCYFKLFMKIGQKFYVKGCMKISIALKPMDEISCYFLLVHLDCITYNEINIPFYRYPTPLSSVISLKIREWMAMSQNLDNSVEKWQSGHSGTVFPRSGCLWVSIAEAREHDIMFALRYLS